MHEEDVRAPADLRVNAHGKDKCVVLVVAPFKLFSPLSLDVIRIDKPLLSSEVPPNQ